MSRFHQLLITLASRPDYPFQVSILYWYIKGELILMTTIDHCIGCLDNRYGIIPFYDTPRDGQGHQIMHHSLS